MQRPPHFGIIHADGPMPKSQSSDPDILVLGEHPATYLAAALLRSQSSLEVLHCVIPGKAPPERLVLLNPAFFALHPLLGSLRRKLDLTGVYGLKFLADDLAVRTEARDRSILGFVASYRQVRTEMAALAQAAGVRLLKPAVLQIRRLDETGVDVMVGNSAVRPKALILGGSLSPEQSRLLGLAEAWEPQVVHRYAFARIKKACSLDIGTRPIIAMSLDLQGTLCWGWLLPHPTGTQAAVCQPVKGSDRSCHDLLRHWVGVLRGHGILSAGGGASPLETINTIDLPLAGAMAHEGIANRTLLIGPAGGFYSACAEDIYPNCWSALFAADALKRALKEKHLQDGLHLYRHKWGATLGDYLRGPQQNLRFLLPLVYKNPVMSLRLAESILLGKSVVR
jgi:hypothetical protein